MITPEERKLRRAGLGGSDGAAVLGLNPWRSPLAVYYDKIEDDPQDETADSIPVMVGNALEDTAAQLFQRETGRPVAVATPSFFKLPDSCLLGNIDRLQKRDGTDGVLEIKTTAEHNRSLWQDDVPVTAMIQLQHYLLITGLTYGSVAGLIGNNTFIWRDTDRDDAFLSSYRDRLEQWWHDHIEKHIPPAPDPQKDQKLIAKLYSKTVPQTAILNDSYLKAAAEYDRLTDEEKEIRIKKDAIKTIIQMEMQGCEAAILSDGTGFNWKTVNKKEYTVKASTYRDFRRVTGGKNG